MNYVIDDFFSLYRSYVSLINEEVILDSDDVGSDSDNLADDRARRCVKFYLPI